MLATILAIFLIAFIAMSIWNAINLKTLINRPMRNDSLNDKNYWELKYKMQYMITIFAVILAIVTFLGYNTITTIREDITKQMVGQLDSTRHALDSMEIKQKQIAERFSASDSAIQIAQNAILGLSDRENTLKGSLTLRGSDLENLKSRITEINQKNIIQQNVYIVEGVDYDFKEYWEYKKYHFKDLLTNTGQGLPEFRNPPFIFAISNEGFSFAVSNVTKESFDLIATLNTRPETDNIKHMSVTLFITEKP